MWPFIVGISLDITAHFLELNTIFTYIYLALETLIYVVIAITCHRLILLGEGSVPKYGLNKWTLRETWFSFWMIVFTYAFPYLLIKVMAYLFSSSITLITTNIGFDYLIYFLWALCIPLTAVFFIVSVRLSLIFPHIALGNLNINIIQWAWQLTKGNTLKLILLIIIMPFVIFSPFYLFDLFFKEVEKGGVPYLMLTLFSTCVSYFLTIFVISALSISYHWLMQINKDKAV